MATYPAQFIDDAGVERFVGNVSFTNATNQPTNSTGNLTCANLTVTGDSAIGNAGADVVGFYGHAGIAQQTGVAVSSAGIHAALVALGLITA
jgi:hypothetical protein